MTHFEKEGHKKETHHHENTEKRKKTTKENNNWNKWASIIQIILLVFIAFQINELESVGPPGTINGNDIPTLPQPSARNAPIPTVDATAIADDDAIKGDPDAPVTIVEFSDYECPFCTRFYTDTLGQIQSEYIDTGKVKFIYRDFPLSFHRNAQKAAEAAECAEEQGKYYEMHDILFEDGVTGGVASFKQYAKEIGLDTTKFNTCLDSGEMASEVQKDFLDGQQAGVQGTPAFFINGKMVSGAQPFTAFQQVIGSLLE